MDPPLPHRSFATRGPGTGIGVAVPLLVLLTVSAYAYSRSYLVAGVVFLGLVMLGSLLTAALRQVLQ
jgi:hypothetical protein